MRFTCFILAASLGASPPACAEFAVVSPQPAPAGDPPPAATASSHSKPRHAHPHPRQPVVVGFGDQAPLSFAVRQIVPAPYQVVFAESVDKAIPVDWKGGKPWRAALSDAIRPLGLTVSVAGVAVTIQTAKSPP